MAIVVSACGGAAAPTSTTGATGTTGAATTSPSTSTTAADAPTAEELLAQALSSVGSRFLFTATITIDGAVTTTVDGRVTDGTGAYRVTSGNTVVDYIIGPDGQWARQEGGQWSVLGGPAPLADPLQSLSQPTSVTIVSDTGGDTVLDGVYPAADLGFADSGEVLVTLTLSNGVLSGTRYIAAVSSKPATVETTFDTSGDIPDVTIPTG